MPDFEFKLTETPLEASPPRWRSEYGAEAMFVGVVRGTEGDAPISGIEYSAYPAMAEAALESIGEEAQREFGTHRASLTHRTGFVAAAKPSVVLCVSAAHSPAAFEICRWYLDRLKKRVPIWKHIVPEGSGEAT